MKKSKKNLKQQIQLNNHGFTMLEILVGLVILLMVIAVIVPTTVHYLNKADARAVLAEAKAAKMAVTSISGECYAQNVLFYDQGEPNGFAKGVHQEIKKLAQFPGEIYLQQYEPSKRVVKKLSYEEDRYVVVYTNINGKDQWDVYQMKHLIQH